MRSLGLLIALLMPQNAWAVAVDRLACEVDYKSSDGKADQSLTYDVMLPRTPWQPDDPEPNVAQFQSASAIVLKVGAGHLTDVRITVRNAFAIKYDEAGEPIKAAQVSCIPFSLMFPDRTNGIGCVIPSHPFEGRFPWPETTLRNGLPTFDPVRLRQTSFEHEWGRISLGCRFVETIQ